LTAAQAIDADFDRATTSSAFDFGLFQFLLDLLQPGLHLLHHFHVRLHASTPRVRWSLRRSLHIPEERV
jgi:hypothetical protein